MLTEKAERSQERVTSYPLWADLDIEPDNNFMSREARVGVEVGGGAGLQFSSNWRQDLWEMSCFVAHFPWWHRLNVRLLHAAMAVQEKSCESAFCENIAEMKSGWKHAVLSFSGLPLSNTGAIGHVLEAAANWMQVSLFWRSEQSLALFLSLPPSLSLSLSLSLGWSLLCWPSLLGMTCAEITSADMTALPPRSSCFRQVGCTSPRFHPHL